MNPRGHIGSEIIREAEGVIGVIPGANDTRTITTDFAHGKNRNNKKEDLAHYVWSEEVNMFVFLCIALHKPNTGIIIILGLNCAQNFESMVSSRFV
jgi:hypothetical protein